MNTTPASSKVATSKRAFAVVMGAAALVLSAFRTVFSASPVRSARSDTDMFKSPRAARNCAPVTAAPEGLVLRSEFMIDQ